MFFYLIFLILSERKFEEMHYLWRPKRYKVYLGKRLFWYYSLQLSFVYKTVSQISFNLFWSGDKTLLSEFLRKWGWFHEPNERSPKYLLLKIKISKNWDTVVDKRTTITTTLTSSCHWKTLAPFCLRKKIRENTFLTVTVNYRKIVQKNKLYYWKQY